MEQLCSAAARKPQGNSHFLTLKFSWRSKPDPKQTIRLFGKIFFLHKSGFKLADAWLPSPKKLHRSSSDTISNALHFPLLYHCPDPREKKLLSLKVFCKERTPLLWDLYPTSPSLMQPKVTNKTRKIPSSFFELAATPLAASSGI